MRFHTTYKVYTDVFDVINCEGVEKKFSRENLRQLANHHLWHRISRVNCDPKKKNGPRKMAHTAWSIANANLYS